MSSLSLSRVQLRAILERFEQLFKKQPTEKVSKLKYFFKIFLSLIRNKDVVAKLTTLVEETQEELQIDRILHPVIKRLKSGRKLRMIVEIGDYDMDYIILDLGSDDNILTRET